jgi:hypothetical protein
LLLLGIYLLPSIQLLPAVYPSPDIEVWRFGGSVLFAGGTGGCGEWALLLEVVEVVEVECCVLLCMLEAVEGRFCLPDVVGGSGGSGKVWRRQEGLELMVSKVGR